MKYMLFVVLLGCASLALAQDQGQSRAQGQAQDTMPTMTPGQLEHFPFEQQQKATPPVVTGLSVGQEFILNKDRRDIKSLIARHLGILDLRGDTSDLNTIQQLIDRDVLKKSQVKQWQEVGVVFGDILANELDLHWVSYQDDKGTSTALQWRKTQNFVFPVTMFSKRIQFGEKLDAHALYKKIKKDVEEFIAYENKRPKQS